VFLNIALQCAARGWHVFPCRPRTKKPLIDGGTQWANASNDEAQIRAWWMKWPDANVAVAGNGSGLAVLDVDHGLADESAWRAWCQRNGVPETYAVRTGRRPEFGVQMYFAGRMADVGVFRLDGCSGQVKSQGGYVMAAGSIHPDSGEKYTVICDAPVAPLPDVARNLRKPKAETTNNAKVPKTRWNLPVHASEDRTGFLLEQTGAMRNLGCGKDAILARMIELNEDPKIIAEPVDYERLESTAANCAKFPIPEQPPEIVFGQPEPKPVTDWRVKYHTFDVMDTAPEPVFIVEGFFQKDVVTAIAAPVGQRKTIIAANVVHSSITGEPLFGHFKVTNKPERVLYLCPEMGLFAFAKRIRNLGLMPYVGKTLFCRTMNSEGKVQLSELTDEELSGALVVVDTAVRFIDGDENSSEHMKVFAGDCFRLVKAGATVLVLFHSLKGTKDATELTLENSVRGSGDFGAFVSSCWATRLQDQDAGWDSESYLKNVKQRDFESEPFTVRSDRQGRLHMVAKPGEKVTLSTKPTGPKADKDGMQDAALALLKANPKLSNEKISELLKESGIQRSKDWVRKKRYELMQDGAAV
jgi:hypothetical protein